MKKEPAISMMDVLRRVEVMNDTELSQTVFSVMARRQALFPQEEFVVLSLPRNDPDERRRIIEGACRLSEVECSK